MSNINEDDEFLEADDLNVEEGEDNSPPTVTQWVVSWIWFFFKLGFAFSFITLIILTGAVIGLLKGFSEQIPIITDKSYRPNLTSQVFDCKGNLIAQLHAEENRTRILAADEIPAKMRQAVVSIEDERYYQHYGIDLVGITRAAIKNFKAGRVVQGASTLTQQLVKNAFLSSERTFRRKAIEAMLAFQLERKYSKDEILTLYLNEIYFGHGAYGLDSASKQYFGKEAKDLTLIECATLAGIPKSPVMFSPYKYPKNSKSRRELVLSKMLELGFISPKEYETAMASKLNLVQEKPPVMKYPYFVTYVRDILLEKYGANLVYNGGLKIHTTLDSQFQDYAIEAMNDSEILKTRPEDKFPGMNGALVCLDPHNGHIKAMYGGRNFANSQFNRATQALRQPGSSFKPFVYGCALENGALPGDMIVDEPISYTNPWSHKVWTPRNYDLKFHGAISLMKALCNSYNVPAVKLIDKLTPAKVIRFARKLGVTAQMQPNLSLALGSGNFTPLEIAAAYGVFPNQGIYCTPLGILRVEDRDGNVLEEAIPQAREVMKAAHAAMLTDMLRTAVEKGTGTRAKIKDRNIAGKTGTTNDYIDAWFNGFSPELVTVVQFGYDMPKTLGPKKAGGVVAAPVWKAFMEKVLESYPKSDFPTPDNCVRTRLCMASGKLASKSCPGNWVTYQTSPTESLPKNECPVHLYGESSDEPDSGAEFAQGNLSADTPAMDDGRDFFQVQAAPGTEQISRGRFMDEDALLYAPEYVRGNNSNQSARPLVIFDPMAAPRGQRNASAQNNPSNNNIRREPGVKMQSVDFRENFQ